MAQIIDMEGIGPVFAGKLQSLGITTTEALVRHGATPQGRKVIAEKTGIAEGLVLKWVNQADLFRIKGVAGQYAELLEAAGVNSVRDLTHRQPDNLFRAMGETNEAKKLIRVLPREWQVADWIEQAKLLPPEVIA